MFGAPESKIWFDKCCKNQLFTYIGILLISLSSVYIFSMALGPISMIFLCLKFDDFSGFLGGPGAEHCWPVRGNWLPAVTKQYGVFLQHAKFNIKHAGIKAYEKTSTQWTKIRKIKADLSKTEEPG